MRMFEFMDVLRNAFESVVSSLVVFVVLAVAVLLWWLIQWREYDPIAKPSPPARRLSLMTTRGNRGPMALRRRATASVDSQQRNIVRFVFAALALAIIGMAGRLLF